MTNDSDDWDRTVIGSYIAAGAVCAYLCAPMLKFVNPGYLAFAAISISLSIILWMSAKNWLFIVMLIVSLGITAFIVMNIINNAAKNISPLDHACARLQRAMIQRKDWAQSDLPAVYQALGCRPQPF